MFYRLHPPFGHCSRPANGTRATLCDIHGPFHRAHRSQRSCVARNAASAGSTAASEETESTIDDEVAKLVDEAYSVCKETLAKNRPLLDATVDALLEKETIDGFELDALIEKYTGAPAPMREAYLPTLR